MCCPKLQKVLPKCSPYSRRKQAIYSDHVDILNLQSPRHSAAVCVKRFLAALFGNTCLAAPFVSFDTLWQHFMAALYGSTLWQHFMAALYGGTLWQHFMAALYGSTFWQHFMAALYGSTLWQHFMAPRPAAFLTPQTKLHRMHFVCLKVGNHNMSHKLWTMCL